MKFKDIALYGLITLLTIIIIIGCYKIGWEGVCRHKTLYCCSVMIEKYPVKVLLGFDDKTKMGHAQGMAKVDGQWIYLCKSGDTVDKCPKDSQFYGMSQWTLTLPEYVKYLALDYKWFKSDSDDGMEEK